MRRELTGEGGKGSADRTADKDKFNENFDRIFGKPPAMQSGDKVAYKGHKWTFVSEFGGVARLVSADGVTTSAKLSRVTLIESVG